MTNNTSLTILSTAIRQDAEGRYCLNDCHKASGGEKKNGPSYWLATEGAKKLVAVLEGDTGNSVPPTNILNDGKNNGTYGSEELILAYAQWISPTFHVQCLRALLGMMKGETTPQQPTLTATEQRVIGETRNMVDAMARAFHKQINELTLSVMGVTNSYDPSAGLTTAYRPMLSYMKQNAVPPKGRRKIVVAASRRCNGWLLRNDLGHMIRVSRESDRHLFHVDGVKLWLQAEGSQMIRSHLDEILGQSALHLEPRKTVVKKPSKAVRRPFGKRVEKIE